MNAPRKPLLSNVIVGRNDDHGGHYLERLQTTLNFLGETCQALGRLGDVEVIYIDWGSDEPIADCLDLRASAASLVRFIEVPARDVREKWEKEGFYSTLAVNVGVRRAEGEFIMLTDSDSLIPKSALGALLSFLDGTLETEVRRHKMIFPIRRFQVPARIFARRPSLSKWAEILDRLLPGARSESPSAGCLGGFSAGQLMHRNLWHEARGYNERLSRPWGWSDNELMMRVNRQHDWMDLIKHGVVAFHIEHGEPRKLWNTEVAVPRDPNRINRMRVEQRQPPNSEDWGLPDLAFLERRVCAHRPATVNAQVHAEERLIGLCHEFIKKAEIDGALRAPAVADAVWRARKYCAFTYRRDANIVERKLIAALTAFIIRANPINLFYWGKLSEPVLYAALAEHSAIQMYLINPWVPGETNEQPCNPAILSQVLEHAAYRGYGRILMGEGAMVLDQLERSDASFDGVELAVIADATWGETAAGRCAEIVRRLVPGGALFALGPDAVAILTELHEASWVDAKTRAASADQGSKGSRGPVEQEIAGADVLRTTVLKPGKLALVVRHPTNANATSAEHAVELHAGYEPWLRSTFRKFRRIIRS